MPDKNRTMFRNSYKGLQNTLYCRGRERRGVEMLKKRGATLGFMRSKRKIFLLMLLTLFLVMVPLASAHIGTPVYSSWTTNSPSIEGVISGGEWTDATVVDFTFDMRGTGGGHSEYLTAKFYVKNDANNIYVAIEVFDEDYDAEDGLFLWDGCAIFFEEDNDDVLDDYDNGMEATTFSGSDYYADHDMVHRTWDLDLNYGGNEDGEMAWTHSVMVENAIGDYTFEIRIPLTTSPDGDIFDLAITSLPRKVGFKLWFYDKGTHGVYPDKPTEDINALETEDGATFGDLWLAAPPPPVGGSATRIMIFPNEFNILTSLIQLAPAIIFSTALTFVLGKLKKKKQ